MELTLGKRSCRVKAFKDGAATGLELGDEIAYVNELPFMSWHLGQPWIWPDLTAMLFQFDVNEHDIVPGMTLGEADLVYPLMRTFGWFFLKFATENAL